MAAGTGGAVIAYNNSKRRGIRNNNPGNLVKTAIAWRGKVPHDKNTDQHFEQFTDHEGKPGHLWGLRAMFMDVRGDIEKKGMDTVAKLITSYAPPMGTLNSTGKLQRENNTAAYIARVSKELNKSATAKIVPADYLKLMKAIIAVENIEQPYPDTVIQSAMSMA